MASGGSDRFLLHSDLEVAFALSDDPLGLGDFAAIFAANWISKVLLGIESLLRGWEGEGVGAAVADDGLALRVLGGIRH